MIIRKFFFRVFLSGVFLSCSNKEQPADLVILDNTIFQITAEKIREVKGIKTIVGGKSVFEKKQITVEIFLHI